MQKILQLCRLKLLKVEQLIISNSSWYLMDNRRKIITIIFIFPAFQVKKVKSLSHFRNFIILVTLHKVMYLYGRK